MKSSENMGFDVEYLFVCNKAFFHRRKIRATKNEPFCE